MLFRAWWPGVALDLWLSIYGAVPTIVVNNQITDADESNVAPAFVEVNGKDTNATASLFAGETLQLMDEVLANLTDLQLSDINRFTFPDSPNSVDTTAFGPCKPFLNETSNFPDRTFELLLGSKLIHTVPLAAPCYNDLGNQNASKCDTITASWGDDLFMHTNDPTSINAVLHQGVTCVPHSIDPSLQHCTLGGYPSLSINVTNVAQVQLAVNLARNLNLRLVIKNTGHDLNAKSTGAGSLSVWTHNMKDIEFYEDYQEGFYRGPAFKLGAGVQMHELYATASRLDLIVIAGTSKTVGIAGLLLGGGHSILTPLYGLGVDQVLSMEVVKADGRFVTASPTSNPDLFWALSGAGPSAYGVVTSVVVKAYPPVTMTTLNFGVSTAQNYTADQVWGVVHAYLEEFPKYVDAGTYSYFQLFALGGSLVFQVTPWWGTNKTPDEMRALSAQFWEKVAVLSVDLNPTYTEYDSFYDAWEKESPVDSWGGVTSRHASRLFPRRNWEDPELFEATFGAFKYAVEGGALLACVKIGASPPQGYPDNSVHEAWRETVLHAIAVSTWTTDTPEDVKRSRSDLVTFDWGERFRAITPGSGAYVNEADYIEPDFGHAFWGEKYERLYELKKRFDPWGVFWATNAVGSEDWELSGFDLGNLPSQNSRLCRKGTNVPSSP